MLLQNVTSDVLCGCHILTLFFLKQQFSEGEQRPHTLLGRCLHLSTISRAVSPVVWSLAADYHVVETMKISYPSAFRAGSGSHIILLHLKSLEDKD